MNSKLVTFKNLAKLFMDNGYHLYLVGGTVRDFLLGKELDDMDAVTDATPEEMKVFLKDIKTDFTFERFGSIRAYFDDVKFDVTTLRKECSYKDSRHPGKIQFVKTLSEDVVRRDFSVNAMYLDINLNVIDLVSGQDDLKNKILKTVGTADIRIKEDPLRIIRAVRFSLMYDLKLSDDLKKAIIDNNSLLENLNKSKIQQDLKKLKYFNRNKLDELLENLSISRIGNMIDW